MRRLKADDEGEIDVAGPALAASVTDLGPIDEYRLYVRPFVSAFFLLVGYGHASMPIGELVQSAPWAADVPVALLRFIGIAEMAGAAGLVLPGVTRFAPRLTSMAAAGLSVIMLLAVSFHIWRGEPFIIQLVVALAAATVAWGARHGSGERLA